MKSGSAAWLPPVKGRMLQCTLIRAIPAHSAYARPQMSKTDLLGLSLQTVP